MSSLQQRIRELGGLAATHELRAVGFGREVLRRATRSHEIRRIRQGWYILPDTPEAIANCARVGGRATCATAIAEAELWLHEPPARIHVAVQPHACQLRDPRDYRRREPQPGAIVHWNDHDLPGGRLVVALPEAIREFARCHGAEAAFVALESAFAAGRVEHHQLERVCAGIPAATRVVLTRARGKSGSITEAVFLFRAAMFNVRIRQQVQIGRDRVDFVLGDRLVIEVDGREFHDKDRDYERDARLAARGFRVMRFSYHQVMHNWPAVEAAIRAAIERGDTV